MLAVDQVLNRRAELDFPPWLQFEHDAKEATFASGTIRLA
jgi:hypothetical protein